VKVEFPAGTVIKNFANNSDAFLGSNLYSQHYALAEDGTLYFWGHNAVNSGLGLVHLVSGNTGDIKVPEPVALPTSGRITLIPPPTSFVGLDDNGENFICDDGGVYKLGTRSRIDDANHAHLNVRIQSVEHTNFNRYFIYLGPQYEYSNLSYRRFLTTGGQAGHLKVSYPLPGDHENGIILSGLTELTNPRPSE